MNILILTTGKGQNFGRAISHRMRLELRGENHIIYRYRVTAISEAFQRHPEFNPSNTIIHCRAAHPTAQWMQNLVGLEQAGYKVVNNTASLRLTSDKLAFWNLVNSQDLAAYDDDEAEVLTAELPRRLSAGWLSAQAGLWRPYTSAGVVVKPRYSQGQGTHVHKLTWAEFTDHAHMQELVATMPHCPIVIQEVIDYVAIYRVVVINGIAGTAAITVDRPEWHENDWKVSVCLNKNQRHFEVGSGDSGSATVLKATQLGQYAVELQRAVGGEINFIDIYETRNGELVVSEINTACNLGIHARVTGADFAGFISNYLCGVVEEASTSVAIAHGG